MVVAVHQGGGMSEQSNDYRQRHYRPPFFCLQTHVLSLSRMYSHVKRRNEVIIILGSINYFTV